MGILATFATNPPLVSGQSETRGGFVATNTIDMIYLWNKTPFGAFLKVFLSTNMSTFFESRMVTNVYVFWVTALTYGQGSLLAFRILFYWMCTSKSCIPFSNRSIFRGVMMFENERLFVTAFFWGPFSSPYYKALFVPKSRCCWHLIVQKCSKRGLNSKVNRGLKILRLQYIPCFCTFSETALKIEVSGVPVPLPKNQWFRLLWKKSHSDE